MFVGVHPVMWAGPTANWVAALDRILALAPEVVLPGHGPVADVSEVRLLRDYMVWLQEASLPRLQAGEEIASIAIALARSPDFRAAPWREWSGAERMVISIATIDRHRRGVSGPVGARERARLFGLVAKVAGKLGARPG
jgi:glyoxylase-like metal-dependent hydrolase (beta-lactamase superfamily II)